MSVVQPLKLVEYSTHIVAETGSLLSDQDAPLPKLPEKTSHPTFAPRRKASMKTESRSCSGSSSAVDGIGGSHEKVWYIHKRAWTRRGTCERSAVDFDRSAWVRRRCDSPEERRQGIQSCSR